MPKPGKGSPTVSELEARMRPGALSQTGFLGPDESLEKVMARDDETLRGLRVTHEQLGTRLGELVGAAERSGRRAAKVGQFDVRITRYTGFQMCPWSPDIHHTQCTAGGGVEYGSLDWEIRNNETRQHMSGPGFAVHLIRDHHFFEGPGSPHRVDPQALARLLGFVR